MKLLTHNMLTSNIIKGVKNGYPLKIAAKEVKVTEVDFNGEFIARMIPRIQWSVLCEAAESIGHLGDLPKELSQDYSENEDLLRQAHRVLMEVDIEQGSLICPETQREFPISNGIPNMLLNEHEV